MNARTGLAALAGPGATGFSAWLRTPAGLAGLLAGAALLARLLFAASLGLGIDESYMVAAGRTFHLGYFDHPPLAWWLAWAAMHVTGSDAALVVRLPFVLLFALSTWLMFRLTDDLFGGRAALWAVVLFNAVPVLGITAGSWVLPDGPLIAATLGAELSLVRALRAPAGSAWRWWLAVGACCGLALCAKYTALLTGGGILLVLMTQPQARRWLGRPHPYAAAGLALLLFSPVIAWNARNGWASLLFQAGRAEGGRWHPFGPLATLAGEALFFLPWIWLPLATCLCQAVRRGPADRDRWLLLCLALPSIVVFAAVSLRSHVMFHWAAPGTMTALPLLADAIARQRRLAGVARRAAAATGVLLLAGLLVIASEVRFNWLPEVLEDFAAPSDPDLDAVDWTSLREALALRVRSQPGLVVAATNWRDAGKLDYALQGGVTVICLGNDPREYGIAAPAAAHAGEDVLIVAPRHDPAWILAHEAALFDAVETLPSIMLLHAGRPALDVSLSIGHRLRAGLHGGAGG